jgi:hypothetical protein
MQINALLKEANNAVHIGSNKNGEPTIASGRCLHNKLVFATVHKKKTHPSFQRFINSYSITTIAFAYICLGLTVRVCLSS